MDGYTPGQKERVVDLARPQPPPETMLFRFTVNVLGNVCDPAELERFIDAHCAGSAVTNVTRRRGGIDR